MGTYATTTSLDTLMPTTLFDTATTSLAGQCITWAENEVNKQLAKRFAVSDWTTAAATPPMITTISEWLSLGYLYDELSRGGTESQSRADRHIQRGMDNLALLKNHEVDLVDSSGDPIGDRSSRNIILSTTEYPTTFDEDDPTNWIISSDKTTDISNGRD